jgi:hypothetical protein
MSRVVGRDDAGFLVFFEPRIRCSWCRWARTANVRACHAVFNRSLTVPLLCCGCGFEVEECHQFQGGISQFQAFDGGPQVDDVPLDGALGIEALEDVFFKMDTEGASLALAVHRAVPTPLAAAAAQLGEQVEVFEDTLDGQLALQVREVEPGGGRSL